MNTQLVALLGGVVSALVAALAYYGKARHERLRTTRVVLYYLLEMRYHFAVAEFGLSSFPQQHLDMVNRTLAANGVSLSEPDQQSLLPLMEHMLREMSAARVEELGKQIVEPYTRALTDLARDDPLLAYSLKGREVLTRASTAIVEYTRLASLPELPPDSVPVKEALLAGMDDLDRSVTLDLLAHACRQVAASCGPLVYLRTRAVLKRQNRPNLPPEFGPKVSAAFDAFIKHAKAHEAAKLANAAGIPVAPASSTVVPKGET